MTVAHYQQTLFRLVFAPFVSDLRRHDGVWIEYKHLRHGCLLQIIMRYQEHHVCLALAGWSRKHPEPLKAVDSQCSHVALEEVVFVLSFLTTGHLFTTENDVRVDISEPHVTLHH